MTVSKIVTISLFVINLFLTVKLNGQIFSVGTKIQKKALFQVTLNHPFVYNKYDTPHEFMLGVDYTTKNKHAPSGILPQATYGYRLVDDRRKPYFVMMGTSVGYNFQLSRGFENQFKISPFLYLEYSGFLNLKVGYDYSTQIQKGYPFVSIGLGGLQMFRHFVLGL